MARVIAKTVKNSDKPRAAAAAAAQEEEKKKKKIAAPRNFKQTKEEKEAQNNYKVTQQKDGKAWAGFRGNTPQGVALDKYVNAYNSADTMVATTINKIFGKNDKLNSDGVRRAAREAGITRAIAVHYMKKNGILPEAFADDAEH